MYWYNILYIVHILFIIFVYLLSIFRRKIIVWFSSHQLCFRDRLDSSCIIKIAFSYLPRAGKWWLYGNVNLFLRNTISMFGMYFTFVTRLGFLLDYSSYTLLYQTLPQRKILNWCSAYILHLRRSKHHY